MNKGMNDSGNEMKELIAGSGIYTNGYSGYSDSDMESLLSDEDGMGLAEGDELMILDSGFGGFDLSKCHKGLLEYLTPCSPPEIRSGCRIISSESCRFYRY